MTSDDRRLGMDRDITRRDFVGGSAIAIGAAMTAGCSGDSAAINTALDPAYPPAKTGMRGAHPGSFEPAHALVQGAEWEATPLNEDYDLIIVGAGISGLSSAYLYRRDVNPDARILILDNHDDFGGHAKRNEFIIEGRKMIGFGGTMLMENPGGYPDIAKEVVRELEINYERVEDFYKEDFFATRGLRPACFFDEDTFGADHLSLGGLFDPAILERAPLSQRAKDDLARLFADETDYLAGKPDTEKQRILQSLSWRDYLKTHAGLGDEALAYVQKRSHGVWAIGADGLPASFAAVEGYPGFAAQEDVDSEPSGTSSSNFYFPDGNASIARLLVKKLVPAVAKNETMEGLVTEHLDYASLDRAENPTRIRLSSIVVSVEHRNGDLSGPVDVTYVAEDQARRVEAKKVIWAGYHAMLPYLCPDVPDTQRAALSSSVRAPLTYTNVLIRNWRSFDRLGFWRAYCPGSFFQSVRMTFPINMGEHRHSQSPDEAVILHLQHIPLVEGLPPAVQFRAGRQQLLDTPFETFERNVRTQLDRMLGAGGFDAAQDIAGITVNRWPHGYAYSVDHASGDVAWWPEQWEGRDRPWVTARQRIGNIAIAGTDAASNAMSEAAIEEAHRAVHSL
ncbi:MAG: NAD(P)-binding protein [Pseudomonadota bacterium]